MAITAGSQRSLQSEINVTPMVDIMLVLLIIFLVVTPFLQPGIPVVLPKDMKNPDVDRHIVNESSVVISIPHDGEYYLGRNRVQKEQLAGDVDRMLKKIEKTQDRLVYIKCAVGVGYGEVVNVINEIRKLGVDQIGLVTDKKKDSTSLNTSTKSS